MRRTRWHASIKWALTLVFAACLIAWPLSGWWRVSCYFPAELPASRVVAISSGAVWITVRDSISIPETQVPPGLYVASASDAGTEGTFHWRFLHLTRGVECFVIPLWAVVSLVAVPAVLFWRRDIRRLRRRRRGQCPACGYDLRATPSGGPCPECGG